VGTKCGRLFDLVSLNLLMIVGLYATVRPSQENGPPSPKSGNVEGTSERRASWPSCC
jgi:hypothetical protein